MPQPLKVLIAEDNPADAELMLRELRRAGFEPDWQRVDTEAAYLEQLHGELDLVLSDYQMPRFNGFRALELLKQSGLEVPFILVSGTIGEDTAVAAMKQGATDYLLKDRLARLGTSVTHAMAERRSHRARRQADEALRIAHVQMGQLLEHSPAVLYMVKLDGDKGVPHFVSENITTLLGFTVAETSNQGWWLGQLHPDDRERAVNSRNETLTAGASRTEYRLRHKDGHYCWVDDSQRLIRDAAGAPAELSGVWMDITERKRAEEIVGQASGHVARDRKKRVGVELLILIAATASIYGFGARFNWFEAATRWENEKNILHLNETFAATVFVTAGLIVFAFRRWRESETELTSRQQTQAALGLLHEELDRRVKQRTEELGKANEVLHAEIVERRKTEEALRASQEQFHQLAESIDEVFWMTDPAKSAMLYISPAYEKIWGRTIKSLYQSPLNWAEAMYPEDRERVLAAMRTKQIRGDYDETYRIVRPDGSLRWIHDRAFPVRNAAGEVIRVAGVAQDVTEKKQLETQFFRAQRLESIGTLASGIAHDLNNILAPIMMAAPIIRMSKSPTTTEKMLATVESSTARAAKLVRQLLTFGRGVEGEKERLSVAVTIKEMLTIAQQTFPKSIMIVTEVAEDLPLILADATQVHQVLLNLCVNARDAMPQGGLLMIAAEQVHIDANAAAMTPDAKIGDYVLLKVTDTGTGMTPEIIDKIFNPFFTTKEMGKGTGLGLATVLGLVKSHGGFVILSSDPGKGSTFGVHFPVAPKSGTQAPFVQTMAPLPGHGELLLVVDDEENIRDTVRGTLIGHGYTVVLAEDGIEGTSRYAMAQNEIKLVITDLDMPNMDGLTMIRVLRQMNPKVKVIVSSGVTSGKKMSSRTPELTALGVTAFLDKPYTADQILQTVHDALAG